MQKHFELVVFTAGLKDYADWILNDLDKQGNIKFRLYRDSCRFRHGAYIKDLSLLGRDMAKTIIVDNIMDNYQLQPENGINILSWFENPHDKELLTLEPILRNFVLNDVLDVREMIKQYFRQPVRVPVSVANPKKKHLLESPISKQRHLSKVNYL
jgi:CTD small phosphatase-like protein 2